MLIHFLLCVFPLILPSLQILEPCYLVGPTIVPKKSRELRVYHISDCALLTVSTSYLHFCFSICCHKKNTPEQMKLNLVLQNWFFGRILLESRKNISGKRQMIAQKHCCGINKMNLKKFGTGVFLDIWVHFYC